MVCPSGFERTTSAVPIVPPPPERFSTTAVWPQAVCRWAARSRPMTSVEPPAAAGTITRTVSEGFQSARLDRGRIAAADRPAAPASTWRRDRNFLVTNLLPFLFCRERREPNARRQVARDGKCRADSGRTPQAE